MILLLYTYTYIITVCTILSSNDELLLQTSDEKSENVVICDLSYRMTTDNSYISIICSI